MRHAAVRSNSWNRYLILQTVRCTANDTDSGGGGTDVDAPAWLLLAVNEVLHPVDVVEAEGDSGYEALQRDLDGQTKVLLQQGAGQRSHRLRLFEVHTGGETNTAEWVHGSISIADSLKENSVLSELGSYFGNFSHYSICIH